jgi:hypothetical protein
LGDDCRTRHFFCSRKLQYQIIAAFAKVLWTRR